MPTVQLPRDTRWGELGAGIGGLAATLMNAYGAAQVSQGVAEIQNDDSIPEAKKPSKILEKFGKAGLARLDDVMKQRERAAQISNLLAKTGLETVQQRLAEAKLPVADRLAQAQAATAEAEPALKRAETEQIGASTERTRTMTPLLADEARGKIATTAAQLPGEAAESELKGVKAQQATMELDQYRRQLESGDSTLDETLDRMGVTRPEDREVAKAAYRGERDRTKATEKMISAVQAVRGPERAAAVRAGVPTALPVDERKAVGASAEYATSLKQFADIAVKSPQELGLMSGASIKGWLERHGIATGNDDLIRLVENQAQVVQNAATSGGGFFAQGRVALARDISPNVNRTPLANMIAIDTIADRELAKLQRQKDSFIGTPTVTKPIDDTIAQWREIKAVTGSLQSYVAPDKSGRPSDAKTIVLFNGDQVDPKTFKPLVEGRTDYQFKGGAHLPGATVIERARAAKMSPEAYLSYIRAYYERGGGGGGAAPADSGAAR